MFNPACVEKYRLFHGDSVNVLMDFKPNSIHSGFATPGLQSFGFEKHEPWQDFFGYRAQWFQLLYEALRDDGSFFMTLTPELGEIMDKIGWIRQHGTGFGSRKHCMHWTKSDDFYQSSDDGRPPSLVEDLERTKDAINEALVLQGPMTKYDCVSDTLDRICNIYTPPGGITLEPTVGYGRHVVAALQRNRRVIGIDWNRMALAVCRKRIAMLTSC